MLLNCTKRPILVKNPVEILRLMGLRVKSSDSISGIQGYEYWPTNYRRFVLQEFYSFDLNFNLQIRK